MHAIPWFSWRKFCADPAEQKALKTKELNNGRCGDSALCSFPDIAVSHKLVLKNFASCYTSHVTVQAEKKLCARRLAMIAIAAFVVSAFPPFQIQSSESHVYVPT